MHLLRILLSGNIVGNEIHGSRTVECHTGNDVIKVRWAETLHKVYHAGRFQLENPCAIPLGKHGIDFAIVIIQMIKIYFYSVILLYKANGILDHGKSTKSQKIHFQKSQLFDGCHRKLGGDGTVLRLCQGYVVGNGASGYHHPCRMHGAVAGKSLKTQAEVDHVFGLFFRVIQILQIFTDRERLLQGHIELCRNELCKLITLCIRDIQNSSDITNNPSCRKGSEGNNLTYLLFSIFSSDVINDFLSSFILKVHVDIRHADSLRI